MCYNCNKKIDSKKFLYILMVTTTPRKMRFVNWSLRPFSAALHSLTLPIHPGKKIILFKFPQTNSCPHSNLTTRLVITRAKNCSFTVLFWASCPAAVRRRTTVWILFGRRLLSAASTRTPPPHHARLILGGQPKQITVLLLKQPERRTALMWCSIRFNNNSAYFCAVIAVRKRLLKRSLHWILDI